MAATTLTISSVGFSSSNNRLGFNFKELEVPYFIPVEWFAIQALKAGMSADLRQSDLNALIGSEVTVEKITILNVGDKFTNAAGVEETVKDRAMLNLEGRKFNWNLEAIATNQIMITELAETREEKAEAIRYLRAPIVATLVMPEKQAKAVPVASKLQAKVPTIES